MTPQQDRHRGRKHLGTLDGTEFAADPSGRRRPRVIVYRDEGRLELFLVDAPDGLELDPARAAELAWLLLAAADAPDRGSLPGWPDDDDAGRSNE